MAAVAVGRQLCAVRFLACGCDMFHGRSAQVMMMMMMMMMMM